MRVQAQPPLSLARDAVPGWGLGSAPPLVEVPPVAVNVASAPGNTKVPRRPSVASKSQLSEKVPGATLALATASMLSPSASKNVHSSGRTRDVKSTEQFGISKSAG